jgi:hypothetical protein
MLLKLNRKANLYTHATRVNHRDYTIAFPKEAKPNSLTGATINGKTVAWLTKPKEEATKNLPISFVCCPENAASQVTPSPRYENHILYSFSYACCQPHQ